jgi:hypothetical protein
MPTTEVEFMDLLRALAAQAGLAMKVKNDRGHHGARHLGVTDELTTTVFIGLTGDNQQTRWAARRQTGWSPCE